MISVFCKVICSGLDMHIIVQDKVSFLLETNHVKFCLYYFVPGTKMSYMLKNNVQQIQIMSPDLNIKIATVLILKGLGTC